MLYDAILFDLDGTLLPMDNDEFTKGYLHLLSKNVAPYGYTEETLIPAMWRGVASMVKNDGKCLNYDAFWGTFSQILGKDVYEHIPVFDKFYTKEFYEAKTFTAPTPLAKQAVELARKKAKKVILATNPMFPLVAVKARIEWAGISVNDFDHITHYENCGYCKPNPAYYLEIADKTGIDPRNSLMVGNNAEEDIAASSAVGFSTYLITDCLISKGELPNTPHGSFEEFIEYLNC